MSRLRQVLVISLVCVSLGSVAQAALKPIEVANIRKLENATRTTWTALSNTSLALEAMQTDVPLATVREILKDLNDAWHVIDQAMMTRLAIVPTGRIGQDIAAWRALPLEEKASQAFASLDAGVTLLQEADTGLTAAQAQESENTPYQAALSSARQAIIEAVALVNNFNRTHLYTAPYPPECPKIVGPHGEYERAMYFLAESRHYMHESIKQTLNMLDPQYGIPLEENKRFLAAFRSHGIPIMQVALNNTMRLAQVDVFIANLFERILEIHRGLTSNNGKSYWTGIGRDDGQLILIVRPTVSPSQLALVMWNDSWSKSDAAAWALLDMQQDYPWPDGVCRAEPVP